MPNKTHVYVCEHNENQRSKPRMVYIRARSTQINHLNELRIKAGLQPYHVRKRLSPERIAALIAEGVTVHKPPEFHPTLGYTDPYEYRKQYRKKEEVKSYWLASLQGYEHTAGWFLATKSTIIDMHLPGTTYKRMTRREIDLITRQGRLTQVTEL